ncbi:isocitrate lyase/PEP mutase family protein [Parasedimentitalea huanghaiensis]|uniref:Isocitrate lyase/phosphoenolpyruvate mutase family protein n=1 Tax=Parasedimentitalea huanghaiensis TaxID=2682100 RepID=A0A6L6WCP5_9RHOB|nr:isocitrate lyase/phosphoenolpyruvate mutase family protein [Zongyanglinia huanghaiensis]MVO15464.1 isocitrate lyase/phosphoenolpyruvate mutase family protein [Zongyanglinia huanghaiensis]
MTTQSQKAQDFAALHVSGNPLVLYNIWDAGSAVAVAKAGATAVATGSWSVAGAQGYGDGEQIPLSLLVQIATRISHSVDVPLSVDFEGGYAAGGAELTANVAQVIGAGAVGINFEDQIVGGAGLYSIEEQSQRLRAARATGADLFINARTDLFLKERDSSKHGGLLDEAVQRSQAFAAAGASGFFVPGLTDLDLIAQVCEACPLPVNVMMRGDTMTRQSVAKAGVARASYGPQPFVDAMQAITDRFQALG